ncbi:MAG: orotidine-5'-phosphate decarboxylase [Patescibacteria group bacterium]|nr:orotidine-5'-phosphate decarboxylase [Patescibacteria group bacterium]
MKGFRKKLEERQREVNSLVCAGLDPLVEKTPGCIRDYPEQEWQKIGRWMINIADAVAPFSSMFKLQRAHFEAISEGEKALRWVIDYIHEHCPGIPVLLDCKRGDIGRTQERYREAHFGLDGADGATFSPYMGRDCMEFLVSPKFPGKALVGLCYTSNPRARETQNVKLDSGELYWEFMARKVLEWAEDLGVAADAGLVMAAAYEEPKGSGKVFYGHLRRGRELVGDKLWFLIPGIGTQGGLIKETVKEAFRGPGTIAINSSSGIIFASQRENYAQAAADEARKLRDKIRRAGGNC